MIVGYADIYMSWFTMLVKVILGWNNNILIYYVMMKVSFGLNNEDWTLKNVFSMSGFT